MLFTKSISNELHPKRNSSSAFFLGSLFNRKEVCKDLNIPKDSSLEEIFIQAFNKWSERCLNKLDGEFCVAAYIAEKNIIFCSRDKFGVIPLYYYNSNNTFYASDTISEIVDCLEKNELIHNSGFIAEYLSQNICSIDETIYKKIKRLPASHSLSIENKKCKVNKYYSPKIKSENFDSQYLKHLLTEACKKRTTNDKISALYLSGGIDSSCILSCLDNTHKNNLHAFSMIFPNQACDEKKYIEELLKKFSHTQHWCYPEETPANDISHLIKIHKDIPDFPNNLFANSLLKKVKETGIKTVLSGVGGDELFTGGNYRYSKLLKKKQLNQFTFQLKNDPRLYSLLSGLTPKLIKNRLREMGILPKWIPNFLYQSFVKKSELHQRIHKKNKYTFSNSLQKQKILYTVFNGITQLSLEQNYRNANLYGLTHTHPFLDSDILEYCLSIPDESLKKNNITKYALREAFQQSLPQSILRRTDKAVFSYIFKSLIYEYGDFENLRLYDEKIVKKSEVLKLHDEGKQLYQLWAILSTEELFKNLF